MPGIVKFDIIVAPNSGFCFGVRRAIEMAEQALSAGGRVFSLGPLIHNPQVIDRLRRAGLEPVESVDEVTEGPVIIRSHGVQPEVMEELERRGLETLDATCPLVKKAQQSAELLSREGYTVVIVGERNHPEVKGLLGHSPGALVIDPKDDPPPLPKDSAIGVIAQTTQYPADFRRVVEKLLANDFLEVRVFSTICNATVVRQEAAVELAREVDIMFVLGGRNSANTNHLAEICRATGVETHHMETGEELNEQWLEGRHRVGVTAGASTPEWLIEEFASHLNKISGA